MTKYWLHDAPIENPEELATEENMFIKVIPDKTNNTLTIEDSGIGTGRQVLSGVSHCFPEMKNAMPMKVPIVVEMGEGKNWLDAH